MKQRLVVHAESTEQYSHVCTSVKVISEQPSNCRVECYIPVRYYSCTEMLCVKDLRPYSPVALVSREDPPHSCVRQNGTCLGHDVTESGPKAYFLLDAPHIGSKLSSLT